MIRKEPEAFYVAERPVLVDHHWVETIAETASRNPRKRMRLCLHADIEDRFHDFIICYTKDTDIQPHKHVGKDETFVILQGKAEVVFYDDAGKATRRLDAAPMGQGIFCVRVPADTYHTLIPKGDLIIYCATPGPFRREDTVWATW